MIYISELFGSDNDDTDKIRKRYNRYNTVRTKGLGSVVGSIYGSTLGAVAGQSLPAMALGAVAGGGLGYLAGARAKRHIDDDNELRRREVRDIVNKKK